MRQFLKKILLSLAFGGLYAYGWISGRAHERQELLDAGYAEYSVDSLTGESTFQLKTPVNILKGWGTWESWKWLDSK